MSVKDEFEKLRVLACELKNQMETIDDLVNDVELFIRESQIKPKVVTFLCSGVTVRMEFRKEKNSIEVKRFWFKVSWYSKAKNRVIEYDKRFSELDQDIKIESIRHISNSVAEVSMRVRSTLNHAVTAEKAILDLREAFRGAGISHD